MMLSSVFDAGSHKNAFAVKESQSAIAFCP
jgi:hypothetical protein